MTNKYCDSPIHKVSSFALAFIILAFCVLPSFASADSIRPNEPVGWKDGDTFRDILLAVLDGWGISFTRSDSSDESSILDFSDELLQEFYEDNNTTQELFWDLVKFGASETGDIILDYLGVNKIRQFANWLKDKFSLTDNSSTPTFEVATHAPFLINGYPCYLVPTTFTSPDSTQQNTGVISASVSPAYFMVRYSYTNNGNLQQKYLVFAKTPSNFTGKFHNYTDTNYNANQGYGSYKYWEGGTMSVPYYAYPDPSTMVSADIPYSSIFVGDVVPYGDTPSSGLIINTTIINIPAEEMDPDDGLQIQIPGTNWGDSIYTILDLFERLIGLYDNTQLEIIGIVDTLENLIANLQHSVTVENIPGAVTLDYDDYDIPLENEWGLFDIFFNTGGDDITLLRPWQELRSIIYGFPAPVLSFFALVVLFVVAYGFIRMGRDSH